jgi:hypothetical protein
VNSQAALDTLNPMKKLPLLGIAVALLALVGCASDTTATFTDADARAILFGESTQSALGALTFSGSTNTISTDTVEKYVAGVSGSGDVFDPAACENSVRPLILADRDKASQDTFYALPALVSGSTTVTVQARLFSTDAAAKQFVTDFQKATEGCPAFTDTQNGSTIGVRVSVSEADADGKGFRMDTLAGTSANPSSFRTYIVRDGNLAIAVQGATKTDGDANLLVAASTAFYGQLTAGQSE